MRQSGKITFIGFVLLVGLLAGGYWAVLYVPLYIDNFEVTEGVRSAWNQYPDRVDRIRGDLVNKLQSLTWATHTELDFSGNPKEVIGLPTTDENPLVEFDEPNNTFHVRYEYDRTVHLVPTDKVRVQHFVVEKFARVGSK